MIGRPSGVRIWLACGVTDLRDGFDGLAALVQRMQFGRSSEHLRTKRDDPNKCMIGIRELTLAPDHP